MCTGVSTELSGPGARTGRARERPQTSPNPILPESQPPSLSADCLPKVPASARLRVRVQGTIHCPRELVPGPNKPLQGGRGG